MEIFLRSQNLRKWLAKKRPKLTPEHAKKRLEWALARRSWTAEDFEGIVYSDECSVEKQAEGRQVFGSFEHRRRSGTPIVSILGLKAREYR